MPTTLFTEAFAKFGATLPTRTGQSRPIKKTVVARPEFTGYLEDCDGDEFTIFFSPA